MVLAALSALADDLRLRIISLVADKELSVGEIHSTLGISQPTASKHLGVLRRAGLVMARRQGLWVYYRAATPEDTGVADILAAVTSALLGTDRPMADRAKLERRSPTVVKPQSWHGTDPEFLD
jgi:ArsR family transcriptional regulator